MKRFAQLFVALDRTTRTAAKVDALAAYLAEAPDDDRLWAVALLSGRRPRRVVTTTALARWAAEVAAIPDWLFAECHAVAGDLAETIALILPAATGAEDRSLSGWMARIGDMASMPDAERRAAVQEAWGQLPGDERFLFNKLLTGGFRIGVSQGLMTRALARTTGIEEPVLAHRLMGNWTPATTRFSALIAGDEDGAEARPYPFCLAHALDMPPHGLGAAADWAVELKWDGIRAQFVRRGGAHHIWSRGGELVTDRFPELAALARHLPAGTVIDGEILAHRAGTPLPFADLQKRIGRKTVSATLLQGTPVMLMAYDLLEAGGLDLRDRPLDARRARLAELAAGLAPDAPLRLSPLIEAAGWEGVALARAGARDAGAEGLMLKRRVSAYGVGRRRGDWWKWKLDPMTVDAVMIYAQAGHGRRANLFTDFTFAVRDGTGLVPFAKAYSGLTDAEFARITQWVRANTLERFGPVRRVRPELVFELAFEGIQKSTRHKSGIALRFPRMLRWRHDKPVDEIDTIDTLRALLP